MGENLSDGVDTARSLEELEGDRWPDPPSGSTSLVHAVHTLRKRPLRALSTEDMGRLIAQGVGLRHLLPRALDHLRAMAPREPGQLWLDDDLLFAVLTRGGELWQDEPEWARHLDETLRLLPEPVPSLRREVDAFRSAVAGLLGR
ncbi:contact-dependent growth inhibition system immunity protein [Streptomyces fragilis]|uniref:Contact-dependent growth inhibition system immunity protein n=1 Tax=Streptomyces fragilis TaxID=67301 RepID=A0ABV2YQR9_9ACTN|nr:contact-dependent growth inhibition system immunity protein [Streptomyces fragilis]